MLTWSAVLALAIGVYVQRGAGAVLIDTERIADNYRRIMAALPLAIISAVVALATLSSNGELELDAKVGGVAAAAVCAWRKLPMFVIVIAAAFTTATLRLVG